jgi:predicted Zn-dependent protease with MMP-like domain
MPSDQPGTQEDFELAAQAIWDGLPEQFRAALGNVTVHVTDFANAETLKAMHISDAYDLLGLYQCTARQDRDHWIACQHF